MTCAKSYQAPEEREFEAPNTPVIACPSIDKMIKSRLSAITNAKNRQLVKHQYLLLNAVGPISFIIEETANCQLTLKATIEAGQNVTEIYE